MKYFLCYFTVIFIPRVCHYYHIRRLQEEGRVVSNISSQRETYVTVEEYEECSHGRWWDWNFLQSISAIALDIYTNGSTISYVLWSRRDSDAIICLNLLKLCSQHFILLIVHFVIKKIICKCRRTLNIMY